MRRPLAHPRRALALLLTLAAVAAAALAAGCGSGSSGSALDDAIGYMPKSSLVIVAIKTDPNDDQYKNIGKLVDKFPFANAIKARVKQTFSSSSGADYDKDIKPLLGNDFVVAVTPGRTADGSNFVVAWKTKGGDPKKLLGKDMQKIGSSEGATIYQQATGSVTALKGDTLIAARTRPLLEAALKARNSSSRMTEDDFDAALGDLSKDALVRVEGNFQTILGSSPKAAKALRVPWVKGLRTFGATGSSASDGIAVDFQVKTQGLTADQQPLAAGPAPAPVVKRPGEVGSGLRNPAQIVKFVEQVVSVTDPKSLLDKDRVSKQLGVDLDKDVVAQLGGNSATSIALDGTVTVRADLKDAATFKKTLATIMKNLPKAQRSQGRPASTVKSGPSGLYAVTKPGHKPQYIGVIGNELVIASDAARAQEFAAQPANAEPGTKGALVIAADPKSLVSAALKKRGDSGAAALIGPTLSAHLQSLNGSVESEADGLRGHFKLTIK
jgi:Protein of unknown function (DUF3352)